MPSSSSTSSSSTQPYHVNKKRKVAYVERAITAPSVSLDEEDEPSSTAQDDDEEQMILRARKMEQSKLRQGLSSSPLLPPTVLQKYIQTNTKENLHHLLKSTRSMISLNNDIWERCHPYKVEKRCNKQLPYSPSCSKPGLRFKRIVFSKIHVTTTRNKQKHSSTDDPSATNRETEEESILNFETTQTLTLQNFGVPPSLPQSLTNILSSTNLPYDETFPDYGRFLEKSLLLHPDILFPFVSILKQHLQDVLFFLGQIDAWIMEGTSLKEFLEDVFNVSMAIPVETFCCSDDGGGGGEGCCKVQHEENAICYHCNQMYKHHSIYDFHIDGNHLCPTTSMVDVQMVEKEEEERSSNSSTTQLCLTGCTLQQQDFTLNQRQNGSFLVTKQNTLLKSCKTDGKHTLSFDIYNSADREKLRKFLDFLS